MNALHRLLALWPILVVGLAVLACDRLLWHAISGKTNYSWQDVDAQIAALQPNRPVLLILGSSRSAQGLPVDMVSKELARRKLPFQAINLSMRGGGTPALTLAMLRDKTSLLSALPPGSKVVYVLSLFELNFVQSRKMAVLPSGMDMLARFGMIDTASPFFRFRDASGFARADVLDNWESWPYPLNRIFESSIQPMITSEIARGCNAAGLGKYRILPVNEWALEQLVGRFGQHLALIAPPVSERQTHEDRAAGLEEIGLPWLRDFVSRHNIVYDPEFGSRLGLPESTFEEGDCDHIRSEGAKEVFARAVVDLVQ